MQDHIGTAAGTVWQTLAEHGEMTLSTLKRQTKLTDPLVLMAVGWLAREHKIALAKSRNVVKISLNGQAD